MAAPQVILPSAGGNRHCRGCQAGASRWPSEGYGLVKHSHSVLMNMNAMDVCCICRLVGQAARSQLLPTVLRSIWAAARGQCNSHSSRALR